MAAAGRRMRCHRAESLVRFSFVSVLFDVQAKQKSSEIYTRLLRIETLLLRTSIFRQLHFGLTFFSRYIRYKSFFLKPHPPLTRSPFPDHGEGFWLVRFLLIPTSTGKAYIERSPLTGMPLASRAYAPPSTGKDSKVAVLHSPEPSPEEKVASLRGG